MCLHRTSYQESQKVLSSSSSFPIYQRGTQGGGREGEMERGREGEMERGREGEMEGGMERGTCM